MKKESNFGIGVGLTSAIFGLIAIFVMFCTAFDESSRGTVFQVMFGSESLNTPTVWPLVIGFVIDIIVVILALASIGTKGKARVVTYVITALLAVVGGVIFLLSKVFYTNAVHPQEALPFILGCGSYTSAIFSFMTAAMLVIGLFHELKAKQSKVIA
jgi:hypothetical protein